GRRPRRSRRGLHLRQEDDGEGIRRGEGGVRAGSGHRRRKNGGGSSARRPARRLEDGPADDADAGEGGGGNETGTAAGTDGGGVRAAFRRSGGTRTHRRSETGGGQPRRLRVAGVAPSGRDEGEGSRRRAAEARLPRREGGAADEGRTQGVRRH